MPTLVHCTDELMHNWVSYNPYRTVKGFFANALRDPYEHRLCASCLKRQRRLPSFGEWEDCGMPLLRSEFV